MITFTAQKRTMMIKKKTGKRNEIRDDRGIFTEHVQSFAGQNNRKLNLYRRDILSLRPMERNIANA